jgi:hypothetical protein
MNEEKLKTCRYCGRRYTESSLPFEGLFLHYEVKSYYCSIRCFEKGEHSKKTKRQNPI